MDTDASRLTQQASLQIHMPGAVPHLVTEVRLEGRSMPGPTILGLTRGVQMSMDLLHSSFRLASSHLLLSWSTS